MSGRWGKFRDLLIVPQAAPATEEAAAIAQSPTPTPSSAPPVTPSAIGQIDSPPPEVTITAEPLSFEAIYAEQGIPAAVFPVEKLLKILEGLQALPPEMANKAVEAMDAADDAWSVPQVLLDAERKIHALNAYQAQIAEQVRVAESQTQQDLATIDAEQQRNCDVIRKQLAELQELLARETQQAGAKQAAAREDLARTRAIFEQHGAQLSAEVTRLEDIRKRFAVAPASG